MTLLCRAIATTLLIPMLLPTPASGLEPDMTQVRTVCDGKFGLCRYVNWKTRQEIIPARFERGMPFSEGLAAVSIGGRFGYIDHRGEVVIAPQFDLAGDFYQGLAEVLVGTKTGIINREGRVVIPPMFRRAIPFTNDVILALEGAWTPSHYRGFEKLSGLKDGVYGPGHFGLYHVAGYWIRRPDLKQLAIFEGEGRGLIWAIEKENDDRQFGLLASDGRWLIEPQYEFGGSLSDERAIVRKRVDATALTGAVDSHGRLVIPFEPRALFGWRNGWGVAQESYQGGKQALLDLSGSIIGGRYFDKVQRAEHGDVATILIDGRWMGLDRGGNIVPHPRNGRMIASCPSGVRVIEMNGKIQITDPNGRPTTPYLFERLNRRLPCDKPYLVRLELKSGFVGLDGRLLFDPPAFDDVYDFDGGYAAVKQGNKWGVIDTTGRFVLEPKFDQFLGHREDLFNFEISGNKVWLTASGERRPEPPIKYTRPEGMLDCGHGLRLVERDGRWGILDGDGKDVIAPSYRALICFKNGVAWAPIDSKREWCPLGPDGALRANLCQTTHYPYLVTHSFPEEFHKDPFESSVLWSRAYLEFGAGLREVPPQWISSPRGMPNSIIR